MGKKKGGYDSGIYPALVEILRQTEGNEDSQSVNTAIAEYAGEDIVKLLQIKAEVQMKMKELNSFGRAELYEVISIVLAAVLGITSLITGIMTFQSVFVDVLKLVFTFVCFIAIAVLIILLWKSLALNKPNRFLENVQVITEHMIVTLGR